MSCTNPFGAALLAQWSSYQACQGGCHQLLPFVTDRNWAQVVSISEAAMNSTRQEGQTGAENLGTIGTEAVVRPMIVNHADELVRVLRARTA
jgi:hypothetical protein